MYKKNKTRKKRSANRRFIASLTDFINQVYFGLAIFVTVLVSLWLGETFHPYSSFLNNLGNHLVVSFLGGV